MIARYPLQGGVKRLGLDWEVISVVSDEKLLENVNKIKSYAMMLQIAALLLSVLISLYVSAGIIKPVRRLSLRISQFSGEAGFVPVYRNQKDELWVLENSFNDMVVRIGDLIKRNNEEKDRRGNGAYCPSGADQPAFFIQYARCDRVAREDPQAERD
ncbi:cell wall metabolism sensor histidine kinase WalK [Paenibacillus sp. P26]|nr:cell wall metabolism sensor histidine kinase WalK [Paenibacillus sp. P26]